MPPQPPSIEGATPAHPDPTVARYLDLVKAIVNGANETMETGREPYRRKEKSPEGLFEPHYEADVRWANHPEWAGPSDVLADEEERARCPEDKSGITLSECCDWLGWGCDRTQRLLRLSRKEGERKDDERLLKDMEVLTRAPDAITAEHSRRRFRPGQGSLFEAVA